MTRPARARALPALASALLLALAAAPAARAADPYRLSLTPDTLRADELGIWRFTLRLENLGELGLYPDSLMFRWRGEAEGERGDYDLSALAHGMQPAGAGEPTECSVNMPALMSRGRLELRFRFHDAKHRDWIATRDVVVAGDALAERFPVAGLAVEGHAADLLVMPAASPEPPAAGVLFVAPAGVAPASLRRWALTVRDRGYAVAVVGAVRPDDAAGPASVAAVRAALERLAGTPGTDPQRIVLWGEDEGATTALLAAEGRSGLAGVAAVDAGYDAWARYRALDTDGRSAFVAAAGRDSAGWRARSPLLSATHVAAPVLVLHTLSGGDATAALAFVAARAAGDLPVESRLQGQEPRPLRRADATRLVLDFLKRRLQ